MHASFRTLARHLGDGLLITLSLSVAPPPVWALVDSEPQIAGTEQADASAPASRPLNKRGDGPSDERGRPGGDPAKKATKSMVMPSGTGAMTLAGEKAAVDKVGSKTTIAEILSATLPPRSDSPVDWSAGHEPLHRCGEPRWLEPCIPLPGCHPSMPPRPFDLVGLAGESTDGPVYRGPCCHRTGTHDGSPCPTVRRLHDRFFDAFYRTK